MSFRNEFFKVIIALEKGSSAVIDFDKAVSVAIIQQILQVVPLLFRILVRRVAETIVLLYDFRFTLIVDLHSGALLKLLSLPVSYFLELIHDIVVCLHLGVFIASAQFTEHVICICSLTALLHNNK